MRTWQLLAIGGGLGIVSLLALPVEALVPATTLPPMLIRLMAIVQPTLLVAAALAIGNALAPKTALSAPLAEAIAARRSAWPVLRRQLGPALIVAAATSLILLAYARATTPYFLDAGEAARKLAAFTPPLVTRLLYGGIAEEIITRWGLMSLLAWGLWRLRGRPDRLPGSSYWIAIVLGALLFAAGHLPVLFLLSATPPIWLVAAVIAGNAVPGIMFGWLFWRCGLEAAMMAHACAHLLAWIVV